MQVFELFFGRSIKGRAPLTEREWRDFSARVVTASFPDGFTAYDADGQWMNTDLHRVIRERSKVVIIAADDSPDLAKRITTVTDAFRRRFHQLSVGVISQTACAAF